MCTGRPKGPATDAEDYKSYSFAILLASLGPNSESQCSACKLGMSSSADPQMKTVLLEQRTEITDGKKQVGFQGKPEESLSWNCLCVARVSKDKIQNKAFRRVEPARNSEIKQIVSNSTFYYLILNLTIIF